MSPLDPTVGVVVRRYRVQQGITQEALAYRSGLTVASLSRIERGVTSPSWASVQAIARALGLTPIEFATGVEAEHATEASPAATVSVVLSAAE